MSRARRYTAERAYRVARSHSPFRNAQKISKLRATDGRVFRHFKPISETNTLVERERTRYLSHCFCLRFGRTIREIWRRRKSDWFFRCWCECASSRLVFCACVIYEGIEREHHHHLIPFRRPSLTKALILKRTRA